MPSKTKALAFAGAAIGSLVGGIVVGALFPSAELPTVAASFIAYLALGARALSLWHVGDNVFERRRQARRTALFALAGIVGVSPVASAQQTIFNVPSADVLDPGKVYLEVDELFRPTEPRFSSTTVRGVVGILPRVEGGINFGGLNAPGPAIPTATAAIKIQPVRVGEFALTAGGNGLFVLKGSQDGNPAGLGYGFASYRIPKLGTRIEFGGWYSSAGYALSRSTGGALATFEQPILCIPGLTVAADWFSGENAIGYVSPGLIYAFGQWTAYAAYSIKNGDSRGNAGLIELGYLF